MEDLRQLPQTVKDYVKINGSAATILDVTQSSHSFSVGNAVYYTGNEWAKSQANVSNTLSVGIVSAVSDADNFTVMFSGASTLTTGQWDTVTGGSGGLTAGEYYFVSSGTAGNITSTEPSYPNYSNPILFATSATTGIVLQFRPAVTDLTKRYLPIDSNANAVLGDFTNPVSHNADLIINNADTSEIILDSAHATNYAKITSYKARGNLSAKTSVAITDNLLQINAYAKGTNNVLAGQIYAAVKGTVSGDVIPTEWRIKAQDSAGTLQSAIVATGDLASFNVPALIDVNSTNTALEIRQLGSGNALLVEDSTNPDSTPFLINNLGQVVIGATSNQGLTAESKLILCDTIAYAPQIDMFAGANGTSGNLIIAYKSRSGGAVTTGDNIMHFVGKGHDGTSYNESAKIMLSTTGTISTGIVPGKILLQAANSSGAMTTAVTITADYTTIANQTNPYQSGATSKTLALTDNGQMLIATAGSQTFSIPTNASVAFPIGSVIVITTSGNFTATVDQVTAATTTLYKAGTATDIASVTIAAAGICTLTKVGTDTWIASGNVS